MEEDFYGTIKFKNGEEIFAKVAASEEEDRTMLILHNPILITEIKGKRGIVGGQGGSKCQNAIFSVFEGKF